MYDFLSETRNYSIFLAFIASSFRVTEEDCLSETDLSGPPSFFSMFSLFLKELIFIFLFEIELNHEIYLVQKETQCFYLQFLGLIIIDFKNCFNSVVLPSNKDLDCIISS